MRNSCHVSFERLDAAKERVYGLVEKQIEAGVPVTEANNPWADSETARYYRNNGRQKSRSVKNWIMAL